MVIGAMLLFDQRLTLKRWKSSPRSKLVPHRRFHQHVVEAPHRFGRPRWRDDAAFDLGAHVRKLNPPEPADAAALVGLASAADERAAAARSIPLELRSGGSRARRVRASRADPPLHRGRAGAGGPARTARGRGAPRTRRNDACSATIAPVASAGRAWLGQLTGLFRFLTLSDDPESSLRRPVGGHKRVAWSEPIPLDSVKSIARSYGHHVTDVLLAGVAGALHRYAQDHGQASRSVRALFPVALPSKSSADGVGNHYASVFIRLPIAVADPQARIEAIARDMATLRTWGESRTAIGLTRLAGSVAPGLERRAMRRWARRASLVVSNLAGPAAPLRIAGHPIRSMSSGRLRRRASGSASPSSAMPGRYASASSQTRR